LKWIALDTNRPNISDSVRISTTNFEILRGKIILHFEKAKKIRQNLFGLQKCEDSFMAQPCHKNFKFSNVIPVKLSTQTLSKRTIQNGNAKCVVRNNP